ncbi:amastin-like surface protein, putative [Leishmania panamensis]|uniref:Amastin-like surface protein, putative n=2 Tax=Leishmania panamensis TaxID=5679 RepID=A0AC62A6A0_LEIPA
MEWSIALLVYVVLQFIAFLLVLVATPLDMFRFKPQVPNFRGCLTLWGFTNSCGSVLYNGTVYDVWDECPRHLMRFHAAEAFAIISIFVYGTAFVLGVIMLFCCSILRWVCLGLNILGAITACIVWATMVVIYFNGEGNDCPPLRRLTHYGAGFGLFVAAWVLNLINIFVLLLSICTPVTTESNQVEQTEGKL